MNHDVLQVFRALLSEYRLLPRHRLKLTPVVQMYINHTLVTVLGAIKLFTGLPTSNPLDIVSLPPTVFSETHLTTEQMAVLTETFRTSLQALCKKIDSTRSKDDVDAAGRDVGAVGDDGGENTWEPVTTVPRCPYPCEAVPPRDRCTYRRRKHDDGDQESVPDF